MRIAQIAPIARPIRPDVEDSIGSLVSLLTEELVRRGHDVTLFATGDSVTTATLCAPYARGYETDADLWDWRLHETLNAATAYERAAEFDVMHSHAYQFALPFTNLVETAAVHSFHIDIDRDIARAFGRRPAARLVAISEFQRRSVREHVAASVVHHGINIEQFPFENRRGTYLLYLGRLIWSKGVADAVHVAKAVGLPLVIAGSHDEEPSYFESQIEPAIDGHRVRYVGEVDLDTRNALLRHAAALVYPPRDPEPFGLAMIEAMACGTPVAAIGIGAVPEIVDQSITGFHVPNVGELVAAIQRVVELDRVSVRKRAEERFSFRRMTDDYERVYEQEAARRRGRR